MLLFFLNNRKHFLTDSVKIALFAVAVWLFAGMTTTAAGDEPGSPTGRIAKFEPNDQPNEQPGKIQTFFSSLRFWDKKKPQPQPVKQPRTADPAVEMIPIEKEPAMTDDLPPVPSSAEGRQAKRAVRPNGSESAVQNVADSNKAPEPPPNPYFERQNAFVPENSPNFVYHPNDVPVPHDTAKQGTSSYSFDTRDWVEFYPVPQESGTLAVNQQTSLHSSDLAPVSVPAGDQNAWNGQATALIEQTSSRQPKPVQADAVPAVASQKPEAMLLMDLSPSYKKRLPYVQTCRVVVIQANFPLTQMTPIINEIEQLQDDLNRYIGIPAPKEKIELCLFKNEDSYIKFLKEFFPKAPQDRRALYVKLDKQPGTLMVQKSDDFEIDLRHEMTHAIIHASIPVMPIWLDEGLAKYFEVPMKDRAKNNPYMAQIRWNARFGMVPSLSRLTKLETIDDMGSKEYRDSWAWTHFFIHRSPETHQLLAAYLRMLAKRSAELEESTVSASAPSLKLYLDDVMTDQREKFKEHFGLE
jgi:hypothetical protein